MYKIKHAVEFSYSQSGLWDLIIFVKIVKAEVYSVDWNFYPCKQIEHLLKYYHYHLLQRAHLTNEPDQDHFRF